MTHHARLAFAVISVVATLAVGCGARGCGAADHVIASRVSGELPRTDPFAAAWDDASEYEAALVPQNITPPHHTGTPISALRIRALHDGSWIAFRLEWEDATDDHNVTASVFSDAAAVQFPQTREVRPSPMMGNEGSAVDIVYFRASWQTEDNMGELYPNMPPIYHPPEAAAEGEARDTMEREYAVATHAGNPTVARPEGASVIAFAAEGFGTLSPPDTPYEVDGHGEYRDGHWYVVIARAMGDAATSPLAAGQRTAMAMAVWNGSNGDVGARKNRSDWVDLEIEGGS